MKSDAALITASSVRKNSLLARVKVPGAETIATLAFSLYLTHKAVGHIMKVSLSLVFSLTTVKPRRGRRGVLLR